mmetsp:Transcript_5865/g.18500  ORF Transcript_5865/g.18500 Transcript_5865/m.18500 type:complete len:204 (+) Transcript_5865:192-803(+)
MQSLRSGSPNKGHGLEDPCQALTSVGRDLGLPTARDLSPSRAAAGGHPGLSAEGWCQGHLPAGSPPREGDGSDQAVEALCQARVAPGSHLDRAGGGSWPERRCGDRCLEAAGQCPATPAEGPCLERSVADTSADRAVAGARRGLPRTDWCRESASGRCPNFLWRRGAAATQLPLSRPRSAAAAAHSESPHRSSLRRPRRGVPT